MSAPKSTAAVIADMLVESTGAHFLDSGGAYGRHWERNQAAVKATGLTPEEAYNASAEAVVSDWCGVTLNIFHFLKERVGEYDAKVDHAFRVWCNLDGKDRYHSDRRFYNSSGTLDEFINLLAEKGYVDRNQDGIGGGYTYNHENCLSQDFIWESMYSTGDLDWLPEGWWVWISVHNGCDARGGFTDFKPFFVGDNWSDALYDLLDFDSWEASFTCTKCETVVSFDYRHGDFTGYLDQGSQEFKPEFGEDENGREDLSRLLCPKCGEPNEYQAYAPPVG